MVSAIRLYRVDVGSNPTGTKGRHDHDTLAVYVDTMEVRIGV
jgi:hypothetical protein